MNHCLSRSYWTSPIALFGLIGVVIAAASGCKHALPGSATHPFSNRQAVGRAGTNRYVLPTGQLISPAGIQVELPGMRPQLLALAPNGRWLATAGKANTLALIDLAAGAVLQKASLTTNLTGKPVPAEPSRTDNTVENTAAKTPAVTNRASSARGTNSARAAARRGEGDVEISLSGLVFAPDGRTIYLSTGAGKVRVFPVDAQGKIGIPKLFILPEIKGAKTKTEIATGLAISKDGNHLYVGANVSNQLHELDARTGRVLRSWETGVAPLDVLLTGEKIYVSNLGGRRPAKGDLTEPAGRETRVRVDPVRYIANEGSVTVIDLKEGKVRAEIQVGLHPSDLEVSPNGKYVVVANSGSDTLSVIDTRTDRIVEKIWTRQTPADLFGAQPNGLAFDAAGDRLFVGNGTQNAVAVVDFEPWRNASSVIGLIPVGWFPGAILHDASRSKLYVANIKGVGALKNFKQGEPSKMGSKDFYGAVSFVPVPSNRQLRSFTKIALENMRYPRLREALLPARRGQPARPVPERVGEPSVFRHVIYVIKENRTYDQILGDMPEGNGATNLCTFGEKYTPNQHKISREFVLLDNTYCSGVQSADGHQWTDSGLVNEYMERQLTAGFPRSYPGAKAADAVDALAWASSGFIWNNALAHGKSFRNYGEWMISEAGWVDKAKHKTNAVWRDFWRDYTNQTKLTKLQSKAGLESLRRFSKTNTVGWDLNVPDVMRAAEFIQELHQFETNGGFPNLALLFLPNDHTGGTRGSHPSPGAQIADNDLAFGRVVEAVSRSQIWPETCIIAIEDDPQAGWDHVSGYRTTAYVVSPYTKRRQTISTQYNQLSVLRTIELILGLPPMNQLDAAATPMTDCFMDTPDFTPFASVPNRFPLDQINPPAARVADKVLRKDVLVSEKLPLDEADKCPEDLFNRILWRAMKGSSEPYPEWAVKSVVDDD